MNPEQEESLLPLDEKSPESHLSENIDPITFIPHRVFLNQVDSFNAKHIASVSRVNSD